MRYKMKLKKKILLAEAGNIIDTLQDAIDLGLATDEEIEKLKEWKVYRIQLNRIDTSTAPDIEWPVKP
ncbi:Caudovirales tail fibre assembly protein [Providencia rustigianii]|nr:Caudovirales tail fibre assembly protein [Providencia rustigianii]